MYRTKVFWANVVWLAALAWFSSPASGAPVSSSSATKVVAGWLSADPAPLAERLGHNVKGVETIKDGQGTALYHVVHLAPSGFVIVAADDQIGPIVAFAAKGSFDPSAKNALRALANKDLPSRLAQSRSHPNAARFVRARREWQQFQEGSNAPPAGATSFAASVSSIRVAPFLQTLWDQETVGDQGQVSCYNYYTPPYAAGSTSNYPSGCVATAMSQLMYYFQYPTTGVGTGAFDIYVNSTMTKTNLRGGNGSGGPYLWSNMPPVVQHPTVAQCQDIGALTFDAGVAVNMEYAPGGSGATLWAARSALAGTFLYPNAIIGGQDNPSFSISSVLVNMVNPNLDARKPVMFGIWASSTEGHCVVCDGYGYISGTLYHHLNLGWSGDDNAWYALPDIDTADDVTFTNISSCIYNVNVSGTGEIVSGRIVDISGNPVPNASVTASRSSGGTYATTSDTNGIFALTQLPSSSHYTLTASQTGYASATGNWSTGTSQNSSTTTGNVWGANFVLTAAGPPSILIAPQSQMALVGGTATFVVSAAGSGTLSYQWSQNGESLTNSGSALTISSVSPADAGTYSIVVSNAFGTAAATGAILNLAQPGGTQLVQNGGFETGSFSDWSTEGNMADTAVMGGPLYVHAGNDGAELGPFGSLGFLLQNLATTPGASYVVSCWLDSPDGEAPNEFLVSWNGTNIFDQVNMVETGWTNLQFVVTASATNTPLEFGFRNDNSYFGLDAVTVNNLLPIPSAPASFATGVGGIQVINGTFIVALTNPSGQGPVVVQASTDLAHWTPVFTNASPGGSFQFTDAAPANMPCRYYRAVVGNSP